ncbi:hypothetical protein IGI49_003751 [Enterococcus sp. AZ071]
MFMSFSRVMEFFLLNSLTLLVFYETKQIN